jgi:hypothetical protein
VVLRGGQCDRVLAVAEGEEGEFLAVEELFEDKLLFGCAEECAGEDLRGGFFGLGVGVAEDYALASGESVGLDDDRCTEAGKFAAKVFEAAADAVGGGGNFVALHEVLGKGLAGLQAGSGLGGAEDAETEALELIDQAEREREFGADYGEGWALGFDYAEHGGEVRGVDRNATGGLRAIVEKNLRDACIAWCADNLGDASGPG